MRKYECRSFTGPKRLNYKKLKNNKQKINKQTKTSFFYLFALPLALPLQLTSLPWPHALPLLSCNIVQPIQISLFLLFQLLVNA